MPKKEQKKPETPAKPRPEPRDAARPQEESLKVHGDKLELFGVRDNARGTPGWDR